MPIIIIIIIYTLGSKDPEGISCHLVRTDLSALINFSKLPYHLIWLPPS